MGTALADDAIGQGYLQFSHTTNMFRARLRARPLGCMCASVSVPEEVQSYILLKAAAAAAAAAWRSTTRTRTGRQAVRRD